RDARLVDFFDDRDHGGHIHFKDVGAVFHHAVDPEKTGFSRGGGLDLFHLFYVGDVGPIEPSADARAHMAGIAVVGLLAANDQIHGSADFDNFSNPHFESVGRGVGVGAGELAPADMVGIVAAA